MVRNANKNTRPELSELQNTYLQRGWILYTHLRNEIRRFVVLSSAELFNLRIHRPGKQLK